MDPDTRMIKPIVPLSPLEESLNKLDLQGTIVLLNILSQKTLELYMKEAKKNNVSKLMKPDTAIRLPN